MVFHMQPYGIQGLLKEGHKHLSGLDEAVLKNIDACKQLSLITRTSLGPNGAKIADPMNDFFFFPSRLIASSHAFMIMLADVLLYVGFSKVNGRKLVRLFFFFCDLGFERVRVNELRGLSPCFLVN